MALWYDETYGGTIRYGLRIARTLHSERSDHQRIEIVETEAFGRALVLDGVFQTSEREEHFYHEMIAHPALVTARRIRRVLIIGGGDGGTAREVLRHPEVEQVVMVEIDGAVVEACARHLPGIGAWDDARLDVRIEDGVAFAGRADVEPFDVILLDGSDPTGPAEGLFDAGFYRAVKRLLAPGGVFALQSESPFLMRELFVDIVRTLRGIFATASPYFGPAPIYASGVWSWTFASETVDPTAIVDRRAERIEAASRYYNRAVHRAAFALPNDIARALASHA